MSFPEGAPEVRRGVIGSYHGPGPHTCNLDPPCSESPENWPECTCNEGDGE